MNFMPPSSADETLLKFPCDFVIKIFGLNNDEFQGAVLMIIHKHVTGFADRPINCRPSSNGKYCALSIKVHVDSKQQLDNIYRDLTACPYVLMAL